MIYVGIDWSDKNHAFCILDEAGTRLEEFKIPHGQKGFEGSHAKIGEHAGPEDVRVAIETRDSLVVDFFLEQGYTLYFVNPKQTNRYRDRHRMSSSKSDPFDAYVLADAIRTDAHLFSALLPLDELSLRLRVLTRTREGLVNRKVAVHNEITAYLKRYFPAALELFGGIDNPEAVAFLLEYPTFEQARTVSVSRLVALLTKKAGVSQAIADKHAKKAHALLETPQPSAASSVARAYPAAVRSLLRQLKDLLDEMVELDKEIACAYGDHPNRDLIGSLPGVAETLGPVLCGELGQDISRFMTAKVLKAFAGSSPVTGQSGNYRGVRFRRACNRHLRRAFHIASQACLLTAGWAKELFNRLRSEGKSYGRALRAVAAQLIEILYACLMRRVPYDEAYHLRMKARHGSPCHQI